MKKEDRTFILGITLLMTCGISIFTNLNELANQTFDNENPVVWVILVLKVLGFGYGMTKVFDTTN